MGLQHLISYISRKRLSEAPETSQEGPEGWGGMWKAWYQRYVSIKGLPDKDDPRYVDTEEQGD